MSDIESTNFGLNIKIRDVPGYPEFFCWLIRYEDDVANNINDFGELRKIFKWLYGRSAVKQE